MQQKRSCCMSVETGTLIFAIFNIVVTGLMSIASVVALIFLGITVVQHYTHKFYDSNGLGTALYNIQIIGTVLLSAAAFIALTFAVLLITGVKQKNSHRVKAYFVYGVVVNVLHILAITVGLVLMQIFGDMESTVYVVASFFVICFIYSLILVMIRKTYLKFENIDRQYHHEILLEAPEKC